MPTMSREVSMVLVMMPQTGRRRQWW
jgi:hypothetical protein